MPFEINSDLLKSNTIFLYNIKYEGLLLEEKLVGNMYLRYISFIKMHECLFYMLKGWSKLICSTLLIKFGQPLKMVFWDEMSVKIITLILFNFCSPNVRFFKPLNIDNLRKQNMR